MARFATAPVDEVAPRHKTRRPSQRTQVRQQYQESLSQSLANHEALVVELDAGDKPLTIRNRIQWAAQQSDSRRELHEVKGHPTAEWKLKQRLLEAAWLREHPEVELVMVRV